MRAKLVISAALVIAGTMALHYGLTRGDLSEWHAGNLPYPGKGFTVFNEFKLYRGGRFQLQVLSPCTEQERANVGEDIVAANLHVVIRRTYGFHLDRVINSFRAGSWGRTGRTFSPNDVWTLPPGNYQIRVEGKDIPPAVFRDRGAAIYLERMEPVGPDIGIQLSVYAGYGLLLCAVILIISCAVAQSSPMAASARCGPAKIAQNT